MANCRWAVPLKIRSSGELFMKEPEGYNPDTASRTTEIGDPRFLSSGRIPPRINPYRKLVDRPRLELGTN